MAEFVKPEAMVALIMLVPISFGVIGGWLARARGRNMPGWGILCALFPIFIMVIYFEKPLKEVPGGFKRCTSCGEFIPWRATACKYCLAEQPVKGE